MNRLRTLLVLLFALGLAFAQSAAAREISLYNSEGEAVAYIDTDSDATIYLWGGKPVAYLDGKNIFGYNGSHLGWLEEGILWDHDGYAVGFIKGAVNKLTALEGMKGLKELKPLKSLKDLVPLKPLKSSSWSRIPLEIFLLSGAE